ncbi:J domain-containing protein [Candidatus Saccharibacteria bacterium]|nr:J domain-containing protein [Candidatus Saccharibacteria bacterium]
MNRDPKGYYARLFVTPDASDEEIKRKYRRLVLKFHPDTNPDDKDAAEDFKAIQEAYEVLSSRVMRAEYDRQAKAGQSQTNTGQSQPPPRQHQTRPTEPPPSKPKPTPPPRQSTSAPKSTPPPKATAPKSSPQPQKSPQPIDWGGLIFSIFLIFCLNQMVWGALLFGLLVPWLGLSDPLAWSSFVACQATGFSVVVHLSHKYGK